MFGASPQNEVSRYVGSGIDIVSRDLSWIHFPDELTKPSEN